MHLAYIEISKISGIYILHYNIIINFSVILTTIYATIITLLSFIHFDNGVSSRKQYIAIKLLIFIFFVNNVKTFKKKNVLMYLNLNTY